MKRKPRPGEGRPSKYKPEYCMMLIEHMADGFSYHSFAGKIGVCYDTLHQWEKDYPEFSDAKSQGLAACLWWDEKLLSGGSQGKVRGYNVNAHKWKMANIHKWRDRQEVVEVSAKDKTDEELLAEAEEIIKRLKK